ncbi:MAG TPA: hypothetical protein VNN22_14365 [Verrucomicrobiae bacterium]|nr:hypothetical protein [Verrucomicrobiae bacterium]
MAPVFRDISKIQGEAPGFRNSLAFKHAAAAEIIQGKTMRGHLRFAVVCRHTFRGAHGSIISPGETVPPDLFAFDLLAIAMSPMRMSHDHSRTTTTRLYRSYVP